MAWVNSCARWVGVLCLALACIRVSAANINWTGAPGGSWATGSNWSNGAGPAPADIAVFNNTGSATLPGEVTSILNANRSITGLTFDNTSGRFHTLDLGTRTLTVTGNLNFNTNQGSTTTTTVRNGTLVVNSPFAAVNAGRAASTSSNVTVDLSGLTAFNATAQEVHVGTSTFGNAAGTLTLSPSNNITAQRLYVGATPGGFESRGTLHLGAANTLLLNEFHIGKDYTYGQVDIGGAGTFNLGSVAQRTTLEIANQNTNTNDTYQGVLDLKNAAANLHLDTLIVAQKGGGPGGATGQFLAGGSGSAVIGDPTARGNWVVGNTVNGGGSTGTVDFSRLSTLTAHVNDFWIGRAPSGTAVGTVSLAANSTIDSANGIVVGSGGGSGAGTLNLGRTANTILTNQLTVGRDYTHGLVQAPAGSALTLGSASRRASLLVGVGNTNTNETYAGKLDLTGSSLTAHLDQLIVGQKEGGSGSQTGTLLAGSSGSIDIGVAGNTANFIVGRSLSGVGFANGIADFSGLSTLSANVNQLLVGTTTSGSARGELKLAATNNINANTIVIGHNGSASVILGRNNTILTNQLTISQDYSNATVTIPSGGKLTLGSPSKRAALTIAKANTNTLETYGGELNLTDATFVAYLGNVIIGEKNPLPGDERGVLTVSSRPDNHVDANSILLGGERATGVLNFGGGKLLAGSIAQGAGTGNFNWTGGQLTVGTFGTPTRSFALQNTATGTLAPGSAFTPIGTTTVYGNFTQGPAATTSIDIAGATPDTGNDQLNVSGSAAFAGTLELKNFEGFIPSLGQNYLLATYASRTGTFAFVAPPKMPQDAAFTLDYSPTQLFMRTVAPVQQNWLPATSTNTFATPANWDTQTTPGTTSSLSIRNTAATAKTLTVGNSTTVHRIALEGANAPVNLEIPQGIRLGVANQLVVGPNATLSGGGQVLGDVVIGTPGSPAPAVLSPGNPVGEFAVTGDLTQTSAGVTRIRLAGPSSSGAFSRAKVSGRATLAGTLEVSRAPGFTPAPLDAYPVLTYASRSGEFEQYQGLDLPGPLTLAPVYSANDLRVIPTLPGDATLDGAVNFPDLVALAQNYGANVSTSEDGGWGSGDFNHDNAVTFADLVTLAQNYNQSIPAAGAVAGASAAFETDLARAFGSVPEPGSTFVVALFAFAARHRNRRSA